MAIQMHKLITKHPRDTYHQNLSRLIELEPLQHFHANKILQLMDQDICRYLGREPCQNLSQAIQYVYDYGSTQPVRFAITHRAFGLIGVISFGILNGTQLDAVIGYWIGKQYQNQGYAKQALKLLLIKLKKINVRRVSAEIYPGNLSSEYLLESVGFICDDKTLLHNDQMQYYLTLAN
jgi:RimJ/RimL family protein N-acetyltransferase